MSEQERSLQESSAEKSDDELYADQLIFHLEGPCEVTVDGKIKNIRDFYVRLGEEALTGKMLDGSERRVKKITDPKAIEALTKAVEVAKQKIEQGE